MTSIKIMRQGNEFVITMDGHAGYDNSGKDIVCAACSVLACVLQERLARMEAERKLVDLVCERKAGDVSIRFYALSGFLQEAACIVDTIGTGFLLLADKYPGYVKLDALNEPV